jgi:hypothetical protein
MEMAEESVDCVDVILVLLRNPLHLLFPFSPNLTKHNFTKPNKILVLLLNHLHLLFAFGPYLIQIQTFFPNQIKSSCSFSIISISFLPLARIPDTDTNIFYKSNKIMVLLLNPLHIFFPFKPNLLKHNFSKPNKIVIFLLNPLHLFLSFGLHLLQTFFQTK